MNIRKFGQVNGLTNQPNGLDVGAGINTGDATATAPDILIPKTAYGPLGKIIGTMPVHTSNFPSTNINGILTVGRLYLRPEAGYWDGNQAHTYYDDANFIAANIPLNMSMFGLTGTSTKVAKANGSTSLDAVGNLTVTGLGFTPTSIVIYQSATNAIKEFSYIFSSASDLWFNGSLGNGLFTWESSAGVLTITSSTSVSASAGGFTLNLGNTAFANIPVKWRAFE